MMNATALGRNRSSGNLYRRQHETQMQPRRNISSVPESIERGKAAIAEAEVHIEMFEEYLRSSIESKDAFAKNSLNRISQNNRHRLGKIAGDEDDKDGDLGIASSEQEQFDPLNDSILTEISLPLLSQSSLSGDFLHSTKLIDRLMKDGEERFTRDKEIKSAQEQGNFSLGIGGGHHHHSKQLVHHLIIADNKSAAPVKTKRRIAFDPEKLSVTRRAMIKEAKSAADKQMDHAAETECTNFKARPLPGGVQVKNNPYALTKAAIGKMNCAKPASIDVDLQQDVSRLDASILLGGDELSICSMSTTRTSRQQSSSKKRKKLRVRNDIYTAATNHIAQEFCTDQEKGEGQMLSNEDQDIIGLHQQISKLKAELEIKRKRCFDTIQALEDEVQCETIDEVGIPELEKSFYESGKSSNCTNLPVSSSESSHSASMTDCVCGDDPRSKSTYTRQKLWLEKLQRRKEKIKEREQTKEVKNVTGKPDLQLAKESWSKAKEEHDGVFKCNQEIEKVKQMEKLEKEKQKHLARVKETEQMQNLAKEKIKAVKVGIDRRSQNEYLDKLSRPSNRMRVERVVKESKVLPDELKSKDVEANKETKVVKKEHPVEKNSEVNDVMNSCVSFADMDDKEFAKMIKKIEVLAKKEIKKKTKDLSTNDAIEEKGTSRKLARKEESSGTSSSSKGKHVLSKSSYSPYKSKKK